MHRPISNGIVEVGQGRRLTRARAHNLICVQKSSPWLGPLHEDAMLSPKRSDVVVYSHPLRYYGLPAVRTDTFLFMPGRRIVPHAVVFYGSTETSLVRL